MTRTISQESTLSSCNVSYWLLVTGYKVTKLQHTAKLAISKFAARNLGMSDRLGIFPVLAPEEPEKSGGLRTVQVAINEKHSFVFSIESWCKSCA